MSDFATVLSAAKALSADERCLLIDELVVTIPDDSPGDLHPEWEHEIVRRVAKIDAGAETVAWEVVRSEARRKYATGEP